MQQQRTEPIVWLTGVVLLVLAWLIASYIFGVPEYLLASPRRVIRFILIEPLVFGEHAAVTACNAAIGLVCGVGIGLMLGALSFSFRAARLLIWGPMVMIQATPVIAIAPLITFWMGYGMAAKVFVVALVSCFPVMVATMAGLSEVRPNHLVFARSLGLTRWQELRFIRVPAALVAVSPSIATSAVLAVVGSVIADFLSGNTGLGFLVLSSMYSSRGDVLMASVVTIMLIGQATLMISVPLSALIVRQIL